MSLGIIAIHTALFSDVNEWLNFVVVHIICRLGVPFFATCTGYFFASEIQYKGRSAFIKYKKFYLMRWGQMIQLYIIWSLIYLLWSIPNWIKMDWFSLHAFIDYAVGAFSIGAYYHLWYLLAMIYSFPLYFACLIIFSRNTNKIVCCCLYLVYTLLYGYGYFLPDLRSINLLKLFTDYAIFKGIFCMLPFLLLGGLIQHSEKTTSKKNSLLKFAVSFSCLLVEAFILKKVGQDRVSYIFCTLPVAYCFFMCILNLDKCKENSAAIRLGELSSIVYFVHPMVVELLKNIHSTIALFIVTCGISSLLGTFIKRGLKAIRKFQLRNTNFYA